MNLVGFGVRVVVSQVPLTGVVYGARMHASKRVTGAVEGGGGGRDTPSVAPLLPPLPTTFPTAKNADWCRRTVGLLSPTVPDP